MGLISGFIDTDPVHQSAEGTGVLHGLKFAVKDLYDVAGSVTGLGNPTWRETHPPALTNAACINRLLRAGAELVAKTHTDEFAYSLTGRNAHYGTPPNPAVVNGIPGGSSSGSASVVAAGLVDFALGTDTGGSVRVPASYCGIYGLRTTHGAIDTTGVAHLARSFDTVGWFACRPAILIAVGQQLLPPDTPLNPKLSRLRFLAGVERFCSIGLTHQTKAATALFGLNLGADAEVGPLEDFVDCFRVIQSFEAWARYGDWITQHQPKLGPGVKERFNVASKITRDQLNRAQWQQAELKERVVALLGDDTVLCLPTTIASAPRMDTDDETEAAVRFKTLCVTSVASIAGLPQLSLPWLSDRHGPVGLSLIGPPGADLQMLTLAAVTRQPASMPAAARPDGQTPNR